MKNELYIASALLTLLFVGACSEQDNYAGGDSTDPVVTIYENSSAKTYQVGFRAVPNTAVERMYILTEPTFDRDEYIADYGEAAYIEFVKDNGELYEAADGDVDYLTANNLMGYITTTVVAEGNGLTATFTREKECFSTALSWSSLMSRNFGDWELAAYIYVTETGLIAEGHTGIWYLLNIPNTDLYMIPAVWCGAWSDLSESWIDYDFAEAGNLIFRLDPATDEPSGVVSTTVSSAYDDQTNGVLGFYYDPAMGSAFTCDGGTYVFTGCLLYGEEYATRTDENGDEVPVMMTISWKLY